MNHLLTTTIFRSMPLRGASWLLSAMVLTALFEPMRSEAAGPTVEAALKLAPIQKGVEYDQPNAAELPRCTITAEKIDGKTGWVVRDSSSRILRRFVDSNGDNVVDLWCYYRGGVEVYRDIDTNANGKADQHRWLNTLGRRWAEDKDEDGRIDSWKAISAEEVSAELVAALANRDEHRFRLLLLSPEELKGLGAGSTLSEQLAEKIQAAPGKFRKHLATSRGISKDSEWVHFSAALPGSVPAGYQGSTDDLVVYENVAAMVETNGKQSLLNVGTMVAVGDTWKLIDAPVPEPSGATAAGELAGGGFFFNSIYRSGNGSQGPTTDPKTEEAQKLLAVLDGLEKSIAAASDAQKPALIERRTATLEELMNAASDRQQREAWAHQLADTISAATQSGAYPDGVKKLEELAEKLSKNKDAADLTAYFRYRALMADYSLSMQNAKGSGFATVQSKWLKGLEDFVKEYPKSQDAPEAMLQLAIAQEFAGEEEKALEWYGKILTNFSTAAVARKAAGARRRLDSVGKPLALKGPDLNGRTVDLSRYRGRIVLVQYWATWCEPCKADMRQLQDLVARYGRQGFSIVGVNLDSDRNDAIQFLQKEKLPWVNIHEPGGLESPLALELGVLTLPTMLLVDERGNVVDRSIHASQVETELKKRLK